MNLRQIFSSAPRFSLWKPSPSCVKSPAREPAWRRTSVQTTLAPCPSLPAERSEFRNNAPENLRLWGRRAALRGDYSAAISLLNRALIAGGESAELRAWLAAAHQMTGYVRYAIEQAGRATQLDPDNRLGRIVLASCIAQSDSRRAIKILDEVLDKHPGDEHAMLTKGVVMHWYQGDCIGGIRFLDELVTLHPDNGAALAALALAVAITPIAAGDDFNAKARAAATRALQIHPTNAVAREALRRFGIPIPASAAPPTMFYYSMHGVECLPLAWRDPISREESDSVPQWLCTGMPEHMEPLRRRLPHLAKDCPITAFQKLEKIPGSSLYFPLGSTCCEVETRH